MKNIVIVANFLTLPSENGNSRFTYLADLLVQNGNTVEVITSNFSHGKKMHRLENSVGNEKYKITLIKEPGYKKNVSLRRFYSHYIFAKNVKRYLKNYNKRIDVMYLACPSLEVGKEVTKYAKKNNIRLFVDIQDLWPEAFKMVFNIPIISNIIFFPMKKKADYIYKKADNIVAVSETYLNRALEVNKESKENVTAFLGTELNYFDRCA